MNFNFENTTINNCQFGDKNSMNVHENNYIPAELDKYWSELERVLANQLHNSQLTQYQYKIVEDANKYIKDKNKKGFVNFLKENKKDLFVNILSGIVSSGLQTVLLELLI